MSAMDCNLSHVVLGRPFVEDSRLKYDKLEGTVQKERHGIYLGKEEPLL